MTEADRVRRDEEKPTRKRRGGSDDAETDKLIVSTAHHPVVEGFGQMGQEKQVEALVRALLAERMMQKPEEVYALRQKANFIHEMQRTLLEFAENMKKEKTEAEGTLRNTQALFDGKKRRNRHLTVSARNEFADFIDNITTEVENEALKLAAFLRVTEEYETTARSEDERVRDETLVLTDPRITETTDRVESYLNLVDGMRKRTDAFPKLCRGIARTVTQYKNYFLRRYGPGNEEDNDMDGKQSLFGIFGFKPPEREDVPIYKNNLHFTAMLHILYQQIPEWREPKKKKGKKEKKDEKGKKKNYDEAAVKAFADYLRALGDRTLLDAVKKGDFFRSVAKELYALYVHYRTMKDNLQSVNIDSVRSQNPDHLRMRYSNRTATIMKELRGTPEDRVETFNVKDTVDLLAKMDLTSLPLPPSLPEGEKAVPEKQQKMTAIFTELDDDLEKIAAGCPEDGKEWDVEQWVLNLMAMKDAAGETKNKRRRRSRMRIDRDRNNYRFEAVQSGIGGLSLEQIPTDDTTFDDVFGASWKDVRARFDAILKFAELEFVHTKMGPRRKMSAHTLVLGPYGCGKNHFSRAVTSDPRVIGVEVSIGKLLTAWAGEAEANVGRLWKESHRKRVKHDLPALIVADEFDAFFPNQDAGNTVDNMLMRMQKELQTMLDGNNDYDGVFLLGMSNEPHRIAPAIYRRMGQQRVFVIKALTGEERIGLLRHLLSGIPLSPDFEQKVDMKEIEQRTEHASGETIGKIVEYAYETFRTIFEQKHRQRLRNIEEEVRDIYGNGGKLKPRDKVRIFQKGPGADIRLTPELFRFAVDSVIDTPQVQYEMKAQRRFYDDVDDMLQAAFQGRKWPDPGFEPPSHGIKEQD